jgi:hypothetical protein
MKPWKMKSQKVTLRTAIAYLELFPNTYLQKIEITKCPFIQQNGLNRLTVDQAMKIARKLMDTEARNLPLRDNTVFNQPVSNTAYQLLFHH